jgi:hypothetical protein
MNTVKSLIFVFLVIFIISCEKENFCQDALTTQTFKFGQQYCTSEQDYFEMKLISDARCPPNKACFWSGPVSIEIISYQSGIFKTDLDEYGIKMNVKL